MEAKSKQRRDENIYRTAVPVRHDPAQGDVRHQDVQGVGQVRAEEERAPRPLPAQGDAQHLDTQERKLGRVPGKGGGQAQAEEECVPRLLPAQGDAHHVYTKEGMPARVPGKGGGHAQAKEEQVPPLQPAQGDAHEVHLHTEFLECFSEHCWSHHKNYEWGSLGDFVHIFNS